jgi:hypothetical protein
VAIVLAVMVFCAVLEAWTMRSSIYYLCLTGVLILPIAYWGRLRFRRVCLVFASVALALAIIPVEFEVRGTGYCRIRLLRPAYGLPFSSPSDRADKEEDVVHYGCVVPANRPRRVVFIEY